MEVPSLILSYSDFQWTLENVDTNFEKDISTHEYIKYLFIQTRLDWRGVKIVMTKWQASYGIQEKEKIGTLFASPEIGFFPGTRIQKTCFI